VSATWKWLVTFSINDIHNLQHQWHSHRTLKNNRPACILILIARHTLNSVLPIQIHSIQISCTEKYKIYIFHAH
jgi:hypothetical protein